MVCAGHRVPLDIFDAQSVLVRLVRGNTLSVRGVHQQPVLVWVHACVCGKGRVQRVSGRSPEHVQITHLERRVPDGKESVWMGGDEVCPSGCVSMHVLMCVRVYLCVEVVVVAVAVVVVGVDLSSGDQEISHRSSVSV